MPCDYITQSKPCDQLPAAASPCSCSCGCGGACGCSGGAPAIGGATSSPGAVKSGGAPAVGGATSATTDMSSDSFPMGESGGSSIPSVGGATDSASDASREDDKANNGAKFMSGFPIINLNVNQSPSNTFSEDIRSQNTRTQQAPQVQPVPVVQAAPVQQSPIPVVGQSPSAVPAPTPVQTPPASTVPVVGNAPTPTPGAQTSQPGALTAADIERILAGAYAPDKVIRVPVTRTPETIIQEVIPARIGVKPVVRKRFFKTHNDPVLY